MHESEIFNHQSTALARPSHETLSFDSAGLDWQPSGTDGFWIKPLFEDTATAQRTWLMKVDAGASAGLHSHAELEQFYVLDGSFHDGVRAYRRGDFAIRAPGVEHESFSDGGALLLLVYSP